MLSERAKINIYHIFPLRFYRVSNIIYTSSKSSNYNDVSLFNLLVFKLNFIITTFRSFWQRIPLNAAAFAVPTLSLPLSRMCVFFVGELFDYDEFFVLLNFTFSRTHFASISTVFCEAVKSLLNRIANIVTLVILINYSWVCCYSTCCN